LFGGGFLSNEKFKIIREELYEFINLELINKYDEIGYCTMYESSKLVNWDVEFIFKLNSHLSINEKNNLERKIFNDLRLFLDESFNFPQYWIIILIILDDLI